MFFAPRSAWIRFFLTLISLTLPSSPSLLFSSLSSSLLCSLTLFLAVLFCFLTQPGYYFRSSGKNMRKDVSCFWSSHPHLSHDFFVPAFARSLIFGDQKTTSPLQASPQSTNPFPQFFPPFLLLLLH